MKAWLSITPKDAEQTNGQRYGTDLPDIPFEFGHLPEFLDEIGCAGRGFGGLEPLTFTEITAWGDAMQINLTSFEFTAIRAMSNAYVSVANNKESECPLNTESAQQNVNDVHASSWSSLSKRSG